MNNRIEENTSIDKFLEHLDKIFQVEPKCYMNESEIDGIPSVSTIIYEDVPEKGMITGITYGLSLVNHQDWRFGRPELMITDESTKLEWGLSIGFLANRLRGDCPFNYSNTINFRERISKDSEMDAFLVFAPSILDKENFSDIEIGTDYKINLAGIYPIYSSEIKLVEEWGLEKFWHHPNFDMYDVNRKKIEK